MKIRKGSPRKVRKEVNDGEIGVAGKKARISKRCTNLRKKGVAS